MVFFLLWNGKYQRVVKILLICNAVLSERWKEKLMGNYSNTKVIATKQQSKKYITMTLKLQPSETVSYTASRHLYIRSDKAEHY